MSLFFSFFIRWSREVEKWLSVEGLKLAAKKEEKGLMVDFGSV